jgi:hypothetical protein
VQIAIHMLARDVLLLVGVHGLAAAADSSQPSGMLANLHNIVIACRHRFLSAHGGMLTYADVFCRMLSYAVVC